MKLLFINAINYTRHIETVYPPLGLGYLASSLKRHFPKIEIKIIDRDVEQAIHRFAPDAVGVSSVSQNFGRAIEIAALCRKANLPVFVGGVHITLLPESLSKEFAFGVSGEAEDTIVDVVRYLMTDPKLKKPAALCDIPGLVIHSENGPKLTPPRPLITKLDFIAFPDRSLLNIPIGETTYLFTSRGCPYKCAFCASTRFWNKVRWFPAEYVVAEIEEIIKKYKPPAISFYDDLFTANIKRLERIVELLCAKGIHKKVKFGFACRANLVDDRLIMILKPLSISMVCMGLESGCQRTLKYLKGNGITVEQNRRAVELFSKAHINVQGTFIIGSPGESEEEILQTLTFIKTSRLNLCEVYILSPFPGTPVWETAKSMGLVSDSMDWERLAVDCDFERRILLSALPRKRLSELYDLFKKEQKKRQTVRYLMCVCKSGLKDPLWVLKKICFVARKLLWSYHIFDYRSH